MLLKKLPYVFQTSLRAKRLRFSNTSPSKVSVRIPSGFTPTRFKHINITITENDLFTTYIKEKNVVNANMVYDNHGKSTKLKIEALDLYVNLLFEQMMFYKILQVYYERFIIGKDAISPLIAEKVMQIMLHLQMHEEIDHLFQYAKDMDSLTSTSAEYYIESLKERDINKMVLVTSEILERFKRQGANMKIVLQRMYCLNETQNFKEMVSLWDSINEKGVREQFTDPHLRASLVGYAVQAFVNLKKLTDAEMILTKFSNTAEYNSIYLFGAIEFYIATKDDMYLNEELEKLSSAFYTYIPNRVLYKLASYFQKLGKVELARNWCLQGSIDHPEQHDELSRAELKNLIEDLKTPEG